jgi:hypothetical protein
LETKDNGGYFGLDRSHFARQPVSPMMPLIGIDSDARRITLEETLDAEEDD